MKSLFTVATLCFIAASNAYAGGNWEQFQDPQSAARGNCPECQPGEARAETAVALRAGVYVDINDLPCGDARLNTAGLTAEMKSALAAAFYNQRGPGAKFAIDLGEAGINGGAGINALLQAGLYDSGSVGQRLQSWPNPLQVANCTRLALVLPKSVTITRIEKGSDCRRCGWTFEPVTSEVDSNLLAVTGVFKNWPEDTDHRVFLRVFYKRNNPVMP